MTENHVMVRKGVNPDVDSYSAFWDNNKLSQTNLVSELTKRGVTDVYACGLAYDFCVGKNLYMYLYYMHTYYLQFYYNEYLNSNFCICLLSHWPSLLQLIARASSN